MSWDPNTDPVDFVMLGGKRSPGLAEIVNADSPRRWDERKGYGLSGAIIIFRGVMLSHFVIRLTLVTSQDWADWYAWKPIVDKPPFGTRPKALDIVHPITEGLGIKACGIENVGQPVQSDDGLWLVDIKCIEYRRPEIALAKPEASKAAPLDPIDQRIEALTKQYQDLAAQ